MTAEKSPIIFVASGTTASTVDTYRQMEEALAAPFPGHPRHWAFSSRVIRRRLESQGRPSAPTPVAVLEALERQGYRRVVMQSLHLICGEEFHHMARAAAGSSLEVRIGMPLLAQPEDFEAVAVWLENIRPQALDAALVLVGHGTAHPSWTAYAVLAQSMAARFGASIQLGLLKGMPTLEAIAARSVAAGIQQIILRPFMLVAGTHFKRDVAGAQETSWRERLKKHGMEVSLDAQALGTQAPIIDLFSRHLTAAMDAA